MTSALAVADRGYFDVRVYKAHGSYVHATAIKKTDSYPAMVQTTGGNQYAGKEKMIYRVRSSFWENYATHSVEQWSCNERSDMNYVSGYGKVGDPFKLAYQLEISEEGVCNVKGYWEP